MNWIALKRLELLYDHVLSRESFVKNWVPVLIWMAVIFTASTDIGSSHRSSRIIGPIIRWFNPNISDESLSRALYTIRKGGHISEFGILAILISRALASSLPNANRSRLFFTSLALCVLYAASDEFHQSFVPSRDSSLRDVGYDSVGSLAGLAILCLVRSRSGGNRTPRTSAP